MKLFICISPNVSNKMPAEEETSPHQSSAPHGKSDWIAPYRERVGPQRKTVCPQKTVKSEAHQKCCARTRGAKRRAEGCQ